MLRSVLHRTSELRKERKEADCHYVAYSDNFLYLHFLEFFLYFLVLLDIVANFSESGVRILFMILTRREQEIPTSISGGMNCD